MTKYNSKNHLDQASSSTGKHVVKVWQSTTVNNKLQRGIDAWLAAKLAQLLEIKGGELSSRKSVSCVFICSGNQELGER